MLVSLPMYDHPAVQGATDRYWQAIRKALGEGPEDLNRSDDLWEQWRSPELLLSQTCGYPYRARLHGHVTLVGTPDYGLPECGPGEYNSVFVVRADDERETLSDFEGATFAYNEPLSQSGWAGPMMHARKAGMSFGDFTKTGGHPFSAQVVAKGQADLAALDALSWKLMQSHDAFAHDLRVLATTAPTPVLPYITALQRDPEPIRSAIVQAIDVLSQDDRETLSLKGVVQIEAGDYLAIPSPPPPPSA